MSDSKFLRKTVVTIGTFDGVHIGHQKIIKRLVTVAKQNDMDSVLLTFFPHPRMVLQKDANIKLINSLEEKEQLLKNIGLDHLVVNEFTQKFSRLTAEEFVEQILVKQLNAAHVIIGYDHHFGRNRSANIEDLKHFGEQFNFTVEEISAQDINDVAVSSTKIRNALNDGDINIANSYLNYNFILSGTVVKGKGLGHNLGFPTANILVEASYKLIPKKGVYIVKSVINNQTVFGMMNIGINPTVNGDKQTIEVHFLNIEKDLYGKNISVSFLKRMRDEKKFDSIELLKEQLQKDKLEALEYIKHVE